MVLIAYCRKQNDFRAFRLDRIADMSIGTDSFEPHKMTLHEYFELCKAQWSNTPDIGLSQDDTKFAAERKQSIMETSKKEGFKVAGIAHRLKNDEEVGDKIGAAWEGFKSRDLPNELKGIQGNEIYAIYTNYESDHLGPYDMILGYRVNDFGDLPEGVVGHEITSGEYVQFTAEGDMTQGVIYNT